MILVLIGYRGTGKSRIAELLGARLRMPCVVMDDELVRQAGMTIPELVGQFGWLRFREMESALVRELTGRDNLVVDTGGGVVERAENVELLQKNACVIWLKARVETIVERIGFGTQRPALTEGKTFTEEVAEVLERRTPLYRSAAHHEIDTDDVSPEEVVAQIAAIWEAVQGSTLKP